MIQIKNAKELDGMRKANALSAAALKYGGEHIEEGMTKRWDDPDFDPSTFSFK